MAPIRTRIVIALFVALPLALAAMPVGASAGTAQPSVVSADPVPRTPNVLDGGGVAHSAVHAFGQQRRRMYAGGSFARVSNAAGTRTFRRSNLMAFNVSTGAVTRFAPRINGAVWAVEVRGQSVYVAGGFTRVNGVARRGVARLDASTGRVVRSFNAGLRQGTVSDMHLARGRLFIGGTSPRA